VSHQPAVSRADDRDLTVPAAIAERAGIWIGGSSRAVIVPAPASSNLHMLTPTIFPVPTASDSPLADSIDPTWDELLAELLAAVREDDLAGARTLLAAGAPLRARNRHGQCALSCAAMHAGPDVTRLLLDAGADPNACGVDGHPLITYAAGRDEPGVVQALVESGARPDARRALTGETALHVAATFGRTATARVLIAAGADVGARAEAEVETDLFPGGRWVAEETPLHRAAEAAPRDLIAALLDAGADRRARTMLGETPQSWARRARREREIIALLRYS
jgi:ankyrin repeat protein